MDISHTSEFDAKRNEAYIRRALGLKALRVSYFSWCMAIFGGLSLYNHWARHYDFGFFDCVFTVLAVYPLLVLFLRWILVRQYMSMLRRMMSGETTSHCRLTDDLTKIDIYRKDLEAVLTQVGVRGRRVSLLCKIWTIVSGVAASLLALFSVFTALASLIMPCGHGQLIFRNDCAVPVEKAIVSFGRNTFELDSVVPREEKAESFFVGDDCTCRVVATLADGLVVSNSYGYYCYGMDCGVIRVTVTEDMRVRIVDKLYDSYHRNEDDRKSESTHP